MEDRCGIINNGTHTCDVEKTEIVLGNSGSFELDKKIKPFGTLTSSVGTEDVKVTAMNPPGGGGVSFFTKLTSWLKILSRLRKSGIATQKYKKMKSASLNFHDSASTALIAYYHKTLLDIINCQKSGFRRKSVVLILVKIKQFIVLIMRTYVLGIAGQV